ncbi:MAG: adenylate/guanylate cyclase domain-containing protein [Dehalococcoidales bacterium]|nr:adenylate/guanylate cyclase domain-containing protein [Dehalococcoidales bacterium]
MPGKSLEMPKDSNGSESGEKLSGRVNKAQDINSSLLATAAPYIPDILLDTLLLHPDRYSSQIVPVEGSLLLADISGFTPMTEKLSEAGKEGAELLTNIINQYFRSMLDISRQYGGDNLKFGGDALLILFRGENHALRAVTAAAAMQRATGQFKIFRVGGYRFRLKMTVGVHSGNFYFATAGLAGHTMQHFILGPETNRVGEIQSAATSGELIISQSTMDFVGASCDTETRGNNYLIHRVRTRSSSTVPDDKKIAGTFKPEELMPYLPPPIVQSLRTAGRVREIEGEHRKVTIIFINLLGINEILAEFGPESLLKELQQYLTALLQLCNEHGGFLSSNDVYTSGLKLILVFGAPVAHEYDTANALRLASELNEELSKLGTHLQHKIGINTGFVFAGDVGPPYRRQYTVMGDAVNLAARLMSYSSNNKVLVSSQAVLEAGAGFICKELSPIRVKGKKELIAVYELEGEQGIAGKKGREAKGELLGREDEVKLFQKTCGEVGSGKGRVVVIDGEAGIGKSRLIQAFQDHTDALGWAAYTCACQSHTMSRPFTPWIAILNSFFSLISEDSPESRNQKVLTKVEHFDGEYLESASLLNWLLDLSIPESDIVRSLDEEGRRRRLFEVIAGLFRNSVKSMPALILIEDLHWADHSSLELVNYLGTNIDNSHILMCLSQRPGEEAKIKLPSSSTVNIALGELPPEIAKQFVRNAIRQTVLPEQVMSAILTKARGNPLFLEEVAVSLSGSDVLDKILSASALESSKVMAALNIPDRIQTLIMSRIDTLSDFTKEVIRTASIIGSTFDIPTLQPLLSFSAEEVNLEHCLQDLIHLDMVTPYQDINQMGYRFKSTLIQDIAYDSLLFARRRELHQQVASYFEQAKKDHLEAVYEILVHHYSRGRDSVKTQFYSLKAAEKARRMFAHEEAIDFYHCGLDTVEEKDWQGLSLRSYFSELIADCYETSGKHEEAISNFQASLRQWRQALRNSTLPATITLTSGDRLPTREREALLLHKVGVSHERNSDYDSSLKWMQSALDVLPERHPLQAAKIYMTLSVALFRKGLCEEAINWGEKGLALARRSKDLGQLAYAHSMLAASYVVTGDLNRALRHRLAAVRLYEEVGDIAGQAVANNNLGGAYWNMGMLDKALHHYQISLEACQRMGNQVRIAIASNNSGEVLLAQGRVQEASDYFRKVVEMYEQRGDPLAVTGLALVNLTRVSQSQQHYDEARLHLRRGMGLLRKAGMRGLLTEARIQEADLRLEMGNIESALRTCQRALKDSREMGMKILEARALRTLGRINMKRKGGYAQAKNDLKDSILLTEQNKSDYERASSLLYLAELLSQGKTAEDRRRSRIAISQAVSIFGRIGAERDLSKALQLQNFLRKKIKN